MITLTPRQLYFIASVFIAAGIAAYIVGWSYVPLVLWVLGIAFLEIGRKH